MPADGESGYASFLGTGWSFPPEFAPRAGVLMISAEEDIQSSLKILFGTAMGERFLRPRYGLNMRDTLFEPVSTTMTTYLEDRIKTTILIYEPRINLLSVQLDTSALSEGRLEIRVHYQVRATNSRYNLVYPFYVNDSNEVNRTFRNV
jgi:uncharacterized protein